MLLQYLDLIGARLERMDANDLLEAIETDNDEAVVQLGRCCFVDVDLVKEEAIQ